MAAAPEYVELHVLVDRLSPSQVRILRAVALQFVRDEGTGLPAEQEVAASVRQLSFLGIGHGSPDLAERSQEILRSELGEQRS